MASKWCRCTCDRDCPIKFPMVFTEEFIKGACKQCMICVLAELKENINFEMALNALNE